MKVILKRIVLLMPLLLLLAFTSTKAEVVKIDDYEYYQDGVFAHVESGNSHVAGITTDGRIFMWGENDYGQLGTGDYESKGSPTDITGNLGLNPGEVVTDVAVGYYHTMIITSENRLFAMGWNNAGSLGDNALGSSNVPLDMTSYFSLAVDENFIDIAAGTFTGYAITDDGRYFSWGQGHHGRLGNNDTSTVFVIADHTSHLALGTGESLVELNVSGEHVLALSDNGTLYGWGNNNFGQLFLGDETSRLVTTNISSAFTLLPGEVITAYTTGTYMSVVTTSLGNVYTAGLNSGSQLGDGTSVNKNTPTDITSHFGFDTGEYPIYVDSRYHSILVTNLGKVFGWGQNGSGRICELSVCGSNVTTPRDITDTFNLEGELPIEVSVGNSNSYVLSDDNVLYSWGGNNHGEIGAGPVGSGYTSDIPIKFNKNFDVLVQSSFLNNDISIFRTYRDTSLLLAGNGKLYIWGAHINGFNQDQLVPLDITDSFSLGASESITRLDVGDRHYVVLTSDNRVFTWGDNDNGQLGLGDTLDRTSPVDITSEIPLDVGDYIVEVYTGRNTTFYLSNNGKLYASGWNSEGQLGDGSTTDRHTPVDVTTGWGLDVGDSVSYVVPGYERTFLVTTQNRIYAVGDNTNGELGDETEVTKTTPFEITSHFPFDLSTIGIISFETGQLHSGLLNENNELYMWGNGGNGRLGTGGTSHNVPTLINNQFSLDTGEVIVSHNTGLHHNFVTTSNGKVFAYGSGMFYALGTGSTAHSLYPLEVTSYIDVGSDTIDHFELGNQTSFLFTQEGNLYSFGRGIDGELGDGSGLSKQDAIKITMDPNDYNTIRFIYMQEEQYIDNSHVYFELYFNYDIFEYIEYITVDATIINKSEMEEDVGKITVRLPNTYILNEDISFTVDSVRYDGVDYVPEGPNTVSAKMYDDIEDPVFDTIPDQLINAGGPDIDWTTIVTGLSDNSPGIITLTETDLVDYDTSGVYVVGMTAEDESGNTHYQSFDVTVADSDPPVITYTGLTELEVGSAPYDYMAHVTAFDAVDGDVTGDILDSTTLNQTMVGTYTIDFQVTDSNSNTGYLTVYVDVVDTTPPTFDFPATMTIEIGTPNIDWTTYMTNVFDNSGDFVTYELSDNVDYWYEGTYSAIVIAEDSHGNYTQRSIMVTVDDTIAPVITYNGPDEVELGGTEPIFGNLITVTDNSGREVDITYDLDFDILSIGVHSVTYHATDEYGNVSHLTVYIDVLDTTAPYFDPIDNQIYYTSEPWPVDWSTLITGLFDYDEVYIDIDDQVAYWWRDTYPVTITAHDPSGNMLVRTFYVEVIDNVPPEIMIYGEVNIEVGESADYWGYVDAYDAVDDHVVHLCYADDGTLDVNTPGSYTVTISCEDYSGNIGSELLWVHVHDWTPPQFDPIETQVFELGEYTTYDWTSLVENLWDNVDPDPTISIIQDNVDFTTPGVYQVGLRVEDDWLNHVDSFFDVFIMDTIEPDLHSINNVEVDEAQSEITMEMLNIVATDISGPPTLSLHEDVEWGVPGHYVAWVIATDTSGNSATEYFVITVLDTTPPVVELNGDETVYVELGDEYVDLGSTCSEEGCRLIFDGSESLDPDLGHCGDRIVEYVWGDAAGNTTTVTRTVVVQDTTPPVLELNPGIDTIFVQEQHIDAGVSVFDLSGTTITLVTTVDLTEIGQWYITYTATDEYDNSSSITRYVNVRESAPKVTWYIGMGVTTVTEGNEFILPTCEVEIDGERQMCNWEFRAPDLSHPTFTPTEAEVEDEDGNKHTRKLGLWELDIEFDSYTNNKLYYWKEEEEVML